MIPKYLNRLFMVLAILLVTNNICKAQLNQEQLTKVAIRMMGHKILLSSGDSTSRVLPIIKESENRYRLGFEFDFKFEPEGLVTTISEVVNETKIAASYIVEVEDCNTGEIIYAYVMNKPSVSDIIPCANRVQPESCYSLLFTILDSAETELSANTLIADPINGDSGGTSGWNYRNIILIMISMLIASGLYFYFNKKKSVYPEDPNVITIGKYRFDKRNMKLSYGDDSIELTGKESDLLLLLHTSANNTLKRDLILNTVWGDEGDYVGRTLDVFISKLRKKLEADPTIKIVNIRGIGYKLVVG